MKHMKVKQLILLVILSCTIINLSAQKFIINKDNKQINFSLNSFLTVGYIDSSTDLYDDKITITGRLLKIENDSIKFNASHQVIRKNDLDRGFYTITVIKTTKTSDMDNIMAIHKDDIRYIKDLGSPKKAKNKKAFKNMGRLFTLTGIVTAASIFAVKKPSVNGLLRSSGIQIGTGILLLALSKQKKYKVNEGVKNTWFTK